MGTTKKVSTFAFLLVLLAASLFPVAFAQSIPNPSVPEFTLTYGIQSREIPGRTPVYTINPYTGQQEIQQSGSPGYTQEVRAVEIKVTNQPFTSYTDSENHHIVLFYNVSYKGSYENDWHYYYSGGSYGGAFSQSSSDYTLISFTNLPSGGGEIDFRVQAQIGYYTEYHMPYVAYSFHGQVSGWSSPQTIEIPATTPTPHPTFTTPAPKPNPPTPTTTSPAPTNTLLPLDWLGTIALVVLSVIVALLIVFLVLMRRRIRVLESKQSGAK
jgi:hypothetical protein